MAKRSHPFPYRTRKLSSLAPMVVGGSPPVRVGRCQAISPYRIYLGFLSCVYRKIYIRTVEKHALTSYYQSGNIYFVSTRFNNKFHVQNTCICNTIFGGLAQLGEHLPYKQRVGGSIPSSLHHYKILVCRPSSIGRATDL